MKSGNSIGSYWHRQPSVVLEIALRLIVLLLVTTVLHYTFYSDANHYFAKARDLSLDHLPYRDFLWEFPPVTVVTLLLIPLSFDTRQVFAVCFAFMMMAFEYASLVLLRRSRAEHSVAITWYWTATVVPIAALGWFRHDFMAVFFATIALTHLARGRAAPWAIVLGFGTKLWPIVLLVPLLALRKWRGVTLSLAGSAALVFGWWLFSADGFHQFFEYRKGSGFQIESIPGALLELAGRKPYFQYGAVHVADSGWQWLQVAMPCLFLLGAFAALVIMARRKTNVIAMSGALILLLLLTSRLLSPQYVVWMAPFVAWLWPEHKRQGKLYFVAAMLTVLIMQSYGSVAGGRIVAVSLVVMRNMVLVALLVELFRIGLRPSAVQAGAQTAAVQHISESPPQRA